MSNIEDIWDTPAVPSTPRRPPVDDDEDEAEIHQRPAKRARPSQALFLAGSDEDDERPTAISGSAHPDVDALFQEFEDEDDSLAFQPLAPDLDLDALRREASAKHRRSNAAPSLTPHAIMSSSPPPEGDDNWGGNTGSKSKDSGKDGETKARRKAAKMDATRLLGENGFPALIKSTKGFVPKGKGHEASDLNRLLQVYQFWTHKMYPKTQFKDTVDTVEKLCHTKRMQVSLSVWRDEAKGLINGMKPEDATDQNDENVVDLTSDIEPDSSPSGINQKVQPPRSSSPTTDIDMDMDLPSRPPSSATDFDDDDYDIDALLKEEEERLEKIRAAAASTSVSSGNTTIPKPTATYRNASTEDDDEAMWAELNDVDGDSAPAPANSAPKVAHTDEDDDMWDIMGDTVTAPYVPPSPPHIANGQISHPDQEPMAAANGSMGHGGVDNAEEITKPVEIRPTNDEDWDDMYL